MTELAEALEQGREIIKAALAGARAELAALDARRAELETLIADGEAALGRPRSPAATAAMTLHDALALVLRENDHAPMTARELAGAVNERGLYRRRDGSPVEVNQVQARVNNYDALFEKDGALIRLREESPVPALPRSITLFQDDDSGFFAWLNDHPDGYFINSERSPKPTYLVLHRTGCSHFTGSPGLHWTKDYVKFCSPAREDLEDWALGSAGGEVTLCRACFG
jgi:hypothetical protein